MTTIRKEISINTSPDEAWDALRDVGALHTRLVPGFVVDTVMEGNTRVVTFGNGAIAREEIVSIDETRRRVAWAVVGAQFRHFNGAAQIEPDANGGTRLVWTTDVLPDDLAPQVGEMMNAGLTVAKKTLERHAAQPGENRHTASTGGV
jgi:carbon monoxide dehydrogenase subunit G